MKKKYRRRVNSRNYKRSKNEIRLKHIFITQSLFCVLISAIFFANSFFKVPQITAVYSTMKTLLSKELNIDDFKYVREQISNGLKQINDKLNLNGQGGGFLELNFEGINFYKVPKNNTFTKAYLTKTLNKPLNEYRVTSLYGFREHPILKSNDFHTGIDLAAPKLTDIFSAEDGIVIEVDKNNIYGNYIKILHGENIKTFYGHCNEVLVKKDDIVKKGDIIAKVGNTGLSTGDHLHFEVEIDNCKIDPQQVIDF